MRRDGLKLAATLLPIALLLGCAVAQSRPPSTRPIRNISHEEPGEIVTVRDTRLDLSTGMSPGMMTRSPMIPVGPVGVRVPVTLGGEKHVDVPAEEITVRLAGGKLVSVVQELSSPPFAPGEPVRVIYERGDETTGRERMQIVRP